MPRLASAARHALGRTWRKTKHLVGADRDAPVILMYHRIASPAFDPWGLCVSPARFREQLMALKQHRVVLPLDTLVTALASGKVSAKATALTFDDGYADNAAIAKAILEELDVPATMFLATAFIGSGQPFWWDELAELVLSGREPVELDCELAGVPVDLRWGQQDALPSDLAQWRVGDPTSDRRRQAYVRLWRTLQPMKAPEREAAMAELRRRLPAQRAIEPDPMGLPMTAGAARALPSHSVTLGGHGQTHAPLPGLPSDARAREIVSGRRELATVAGVAEPSGFAYPHGDWDADTREAVVRAGFDWAVTTHEAKINVRRHDRFALPRMKAGDWSGAELLETIGRLTL